MKIWQCREELGHLDLEKKLDRIMKKLEGATIFFGLEKDFADGSYVMYRYSAYFLESRNIVVGVSCYLGKRPSEYIINFYGPDEEIEKLEQILEKEISLKEMDRKGNLGLIIVACLLGVIILISLVMNFASRDCSNSKDCASN